MLSSATKAAANVTKKLAENDIRNGARAAVDDAADALDDKAHHVIDRVNDYAHDAGAKVRDLYDRTRDTTSRVGHDLESEIKTNPVRASLIALGAGFILGALFANRR
jgi:ElaB/YqjD/DUF883 family membrane-anchored ribosome-binding protein